MHKHLDEIPSVVVFFYDLDWDEEEWESKLAQSCSYIKTIRQSLLGRQTQFVVVLIQTRASLPNGEDLIVAERAQEFCHKADLAPNNLLVLPDPEDLKGFVSLLIDQFKKLAIIYYNLEIKHIKSHRDFLNKTNHQLLFARHEFKMAFFSEIKQDFKAAFKHYRQAYNFLIEIPKFNAHLLEIKTMACYVNYKICAIAFKKDVNDAIQQFRRHVDTFKSEVGEPTLAFEHEAWLSVQFRLFGDLFSEAIASHLKGILIQHPGLYYQEAARHAIARRTCIQRHSLEQLEQEDESLASYNSKSTEFVGQRPWRETIRSIEPPDSLKEMEAMDALLRMEMGVNHSFKIVNLLESAYVQYKRFKATRTRLYPVLLMAEEFLLTRQFERVLHRLEPTLSEFRREHFDAIFSSVLLTLLRADYETGNLDSFMLHSFELLGPRSYLKLGERLDVLHRVHQLVSGLAPIGNGSELTDYFSLPSKTDSASVEAIWQTEFTRISSQKIALKLDSLASFIDCRAMFVSDHFDNDQPVHVMVFFKSNAPNLIHLSDVSLQLLVEYNNDANNKLVLNNRLTCSWSEMFTLDPVDSPMVGIHFVLDNYVTARFLKFALLPRPGYLDRPFGLKTLDNLQIQRVSAKLCPPQGMTPVVSAPVEKPNVYLTWDLNQPQTVTPVDPSLVQDVFSEENGKYGLPCLPSNWDGLLNFVRAEVTPRIAKVDVHFDAPKPALVAEVFPIKCKLEFHEDSPISNLKLVAHMVEARNSVKSSGPAELHLEPTALNCCLPTHAAKGSHTVKAQTSSLFHAPTRFAETFERLARAKGTAFDKNMSSSSNLSIGNPDRDSLKHLTEKVFPQETTFQPTDTLTETIYASFASQGERRLQLNVSYNIEVSMPRYETSLFLVTGENSSRRSMRYKILAKCDAQRVCYVQNSEKSTFTVKTYATFDINLNLQPPFDISWYTLTLTQRPIQELIVGERFMLQLTVKNTSHGKIQLLSTQFHLHPCVKPVDPIPDLQINNMSINSEETVSEVQAFCVESSLDPTDLLGLGSYVISWQRIPEEASSFKGTELPLNESLFILENFPVEVLPISVELENVPAAGTEMKPFNLAYAITNISDLVQDVKFSIEASDHLLHAGLKASSISLLPRVKKHIPMTLVPMQAGLLELPKLSISLPRQQDLAVTNDATFNLHDSLTNKLTRSLPAYLFIFTVFEEVQVTPLAEVERILNKNVSTKIQTSKKDDPNLPTDDTKSVLSDKRVELKKEFRRFSLDTRTPKLPKKLKTAKVSKIDEVDVSSFMNVSLFPNVAPTIRFITSTDKTAKPTQIPTKLRQLMRYRDSTCTPACLRRVFTATGFRSSKNFNWLETLDQIQSNDWLIHYGRYPKGPTYQTLKMHQMVNHIPCSFHLGRKDRLHENNERARRIFGRSKFNYLPETFVLPNDLSELKKAWDSETENMERVKWILKPSAASRGIGIRLIDKWSQVPKKRNCIVQRYIANPYLINGNKFDLRIYAVVSCVDPLRVYIHQDGLVRFASQKYTNSNNHLSNRFIHLTNYSINKMSADYVNNNNENAMQGHKWGLRLLWSYLAQKGVQVDYIWANIKDLVIKTVLSCESKLFSALDQFAPRSHCASELFGFDVLLDEKLEPWLIEVNISPSMHSDTPLDDAIKSKVLCDFYNLVGVELPKLDWVSPPIIKYLDRPNPVKSQTDDEGDDFSDSEIPVAQQAVRVQRSRSAVRSSSFASPRSIRTNLFEADPLSWPGPSSHNEKLKQRYFNRRAHSLSFPYITDDSESRYQIRGDSKSKSRSRASLKPPGFSDARTRLLLLLAPRPSHPTTGCIQPLAV
ncbi:Tubulin polyglutamylase ttll4 [Cichlidogyrus casuarinus]|uniref:Trafficking protein particle complex subunit 11 n=1 Tax=Cichlidogyrus casuarinus TaxID=1844966 RepID=A0ABD2QF94_9PLAT